MTAFAPKVGDHMTPKRNTIILSRGVWMTPRRGLLGLAGIYVLAGEAGRV
jgi:hypothetical protein